MITLPLHDLATRSASGYLIRYILPRMEPPQLLGTMDRKEPFQMLILGDLILGTGHGSPTEFCGHNNQVIMDTEHIPNVSGKVIKLLSCETGQVLGKRIIEAGGKAFMGFVEDYVWVMDADLASRPFADPLAAKCLIPVVSGINLLLDGATAQEAFEAELAGYSQNAEVEEDELIKSCLEFNRDNAVLLGNPSIRIRKRPPLPFPFRLLEPPPLPPLGFGL